MAAKGSDRPPRELRKGRAPRSPAALSRAERNIQWVEHFCRVPEGRMVGKPVKLREWQKVEIRKVYDNPVGTRRAIISFGRKNGKTALAAFLLLLHTCGPEARPNSQLNSAAQSKEQAAILFKLAAKIGLDANHGARHLAGHPDGRARHWRRFTEALDGNALDAEQEQRLVAGATQAFQRVHGYVEQAFAD